VIAIDANPIPVSAYTGTIHFTSSDPQAVLPADYTFTAADAGVHTFTVTLKTAGSRSVTATDTASSSITGSTTVTVNPAAASSIVLAGYSSPTTAGVANGFTVTARDAYGNVASGYTGTLHFTSSDPLAALPADYTYTAADAGVHSFNATLETAGSRSITATDTASSSMTSSTTVTVNPAAASAIVVAGFPTPTAVGAAHNFTVTALDAYGNVATGFTGIVSFTSSDPQAVLPANYTYTAADAGVHTFSATFNTPGTQSLTATDPPPVSPPFSGSQTGITVTSPTQQSGLVAAYAFNEGSGTTVHDLSGNGNIGTIANATWTTTGVYGDALAFNGISSWVTIKDSPSLNLTKSMTLEAWVKPATLVDWAAILLKERPNGLSYSLYATGAGVSPPSTFINVGGPDQNTYGTAILPLNTWTHVASTYNGNALKLYINGNLVGSEPVNGNMMESSSGVLRIGGDSVWGEYFQGLIDEVRVYNKVLTQAQIQTDMATAVVANKVWEQATAADFNTGTFQGTALASTSGGGVRLAPTSSTTFTSTGTFTSVVFDAGGVATWGTARWTANLPSATTLVVQTRSGNSATPDSTWSSWTSVSNSGQISSPSGRYLQYRLVLTTNKPTATPTLFGIDFSWT
jgi:hypothetical protein